ncbi:MAG: hypothetical protein Kow00117_16200 [Phototrophicales bacterium]
MSLIYAAQGMMQSNHTGRSAGLYPTCCHLCNLLPDCFDGALLLAGRKDKGWWAHPDGIR